MRNKEKEFQSFYINFDISVRYPKEVLDGKFDIPVKREVWPGDINL